MKPGEFIINGESSLDYDTFIQDRPNIQAPVRRIERKETRSRSGYLPMDSGAYEDSPLELILFTDGKGETAAKKRASLYNLFDSGDYIEIEFYFDPGKVYRVLTTEEPLEFETKYYYNEGQSWKVNLTVFPYKMLSDPEEVVLTSSGSITNPTLTESEPNIIIDGSGTIDLNVNGNEFRMKGVKSHGLTLNGEIKKAYHIRDNGELVNENDKTYTRVYPVLKPGVNDISWSGDVNKITIEPRWRTKI